jgi:hypothetical protein
MVGFGRVHTRGNETLVDGERFYDRRAIATFVLEVHNDLSRGHVNGILAFRELADLVKNHIVDIEPLFWGSHWRRRGEHEIAHTACNNMNERVGR